MLLRTDRRLFPQLFEFEFSQTSTGDRNMENIFFIAFRKQRDEEKKTTCYLDCQNVNFLCWRHYYVNSLCYFCAPSSYGNSKCVFFRLVSNVILSQT